MTVIEPCTFARQLGMVGDFIRWIGNIAGFLLAECPISLNDPCRTSHSSPRAASNLGGRPTLARQQELRISSQSGTRIATGAGKAAIQPQPDNHDSFNNVLSFTEKSKSQTPLRL